MANVSEKCLLKPTKKRKRSSSTKGGGSGIPGLLPPVKRVKGVLPNGGCTTVSKLKEKLTKKMTSKMDGARFRWINEQLYTVSGGEAKEMFDEDPGLFDVYHKGFMTQTLKWPTNPVDRVIAYVRTLPNTSVVADFGCGEAKLSQSVPNTVHSYDLVAANEHVVACDMANVPLPSSSVDVCVFCLSLMGTNVSDFIKEARRVLKKNGQLKVCEIASRFVSEDEFVQRVEKFGFELLSKKLFSKLFLDFEFKVVALRKSRAKLPDIELKPCMYKRR